MTPIRQSELNCPGCQAMSWVLDSDHRGTDGPTISYRARRYRCASCGHDGPGWTLGQQSPPEFLLQPHKLYPMTQAAFDYWVAILKQHFPSNTALDRLGTTFRPFLPEEAQARREAHERTHPVVEMTDQDWARRQEPDLATAFEWLEIMTGGDSLIFRRRDGGTLRVQRERSGQVARCLDETGTLLIEAAGLDDQTVRKAVQQYLRGNTAGSIRCIRRVMV